MPDDTLLIAQWMDGTTVWGFETNGVYSVDVGLLSYFALITKAVGDHRFSIRYDRFELTENDQTPLERNSEDVHAWTFAYQFQASKSVALAAEWLQVEGFREAWAVLRSQPVKHGEPAAIESSPALRQPTVTRR